jgi:hypothetical protein
MTISYRWRGDFSSAEANALHAECFGHPVLGDDEWDWRARSSGTVSAGCAPATGPRWSGSSPPTPA